MIRIILALLFTISAVQAQFFNPPLYFANPTASYVGPGDIQSSGIFAWFGLRGYSAAAVLASTKSINIIRVSDNHTCDILIALSGDLGNTANCSTGGDNGQSALSFIGIHGTCTGTTSGTTLSCTGATVTPSANDFVSGSGIIGLYIVSCGTFTSGSGTCTLNFAPSTISSPETITFVNTAYVITFYDQTGNNCHVSVSGTLRPGFNPTGLNGTLPILLPGLNATTSFDHMTCTTASVPTYATAVSAKQTNPGTAQILISQFDAGNNPSGITLYYFSAVNSPTIYGGTNLTGTGTDGNLLSLQGLINGASSVISVNGTETTGNAGSGGVSDLNGCVGANGGTCTASGFQGSLGEAGMWTATPNSTVRTNMCHNMRLYWGTAGLC